MSEEILKALMQLFAIIAKQDDGATPTHRLFVEGFLKFQLASEKVNEYLALYDNFLNDGKEKQVEDAGEKKEPRLTSVKDSVRTLGICKKINKTLSQKQKVVVLVRLWELLKKENQFTTQRISIIDTVSTTFNIPAEEQKLIHHFIVSESPYSMDTEDMLVIDSNEFPTGTVEHTLKHIYSESLHGLVTIIRIKSIDLYFAQYKGKNLLTINGLSFDANTVYVFAPGSNVRLPKGTVYFSDIAGRFLRDINFENLAFSAKNVSFNFPNGKIGLRDVSLSESLGKLVAIMGASGAGKTTLLNVLAGLEKPSGGTVEINGINLHLETEKLDGVIGYIAQDDLLIEELTVYENLLFNAKLCFANLSEKEIHDRVEKTLNSLGLLEAKDIKVGSPLDKKISGGQRKRLNISLELIREPAVLFVDEPTSGLSSADSENVMDLFKELSVKGKLIFVVIHQPSSDIYKMFDKLILMDVGGYPIYYGNPIDAVTYFKKHTNQVKAEIGECHACGNVNPEQLFALVESKVVDEYGHFKSERKVKPFEWSEKYKEKTLITFIKDSDKLPAKAFEIPSKIRQLVVFINRDVIAKIANKQYILINLLEAPLLALILSLIIKYVGNSESGTYLYRENENVPAYIFMSIIIAMFVGLTLSAEEIFKDRKLLKRERLLNLSRLSYLFSKLIILFSFSAIQMLLFVWIGNAVIGIKGMYFSYWLALFAVSCFSNMLGLVISSTFNSAVTIYILIPLLVIPQMVLGGAMFSFDKINELFGGGAGKKTPLIAETMAARWAFEGLIVHQFKENDYEKPFFEINKVKSLCSYKQNYYFPKLDAILADAQGKIYATGTEEKQIYSLDLLTLKNELSLEMNNVKSIEFDGLEKLNVNDFSLLSVDEVSEYIGELKDYYSKAFNSYDKKKDKEVYELQVTKAKAIIQAKIFDESFNESLSDLVKKNLAKSKIIQFDAHLEQVVDPIYKSPSAENVWSFRTHFFAPEKYFMKKYFDTFAFNLSVIWSMTLILFLILYFDVIKKMFSVFNFRKK